MASANPDRATMCLEILSAVVLQNRDRISLLWEAVTDHLRGIIAESTSYHLVEHAVVILLRLATRLLGAKGGEVGEAVLASLKLLVSLEPAVKDALADKIAFGVLRLLRDNVADLGGAVLAPGAPAWPHVFLLLEYSAAHVKAAPLGLAALRLLIEDCGPRVMGRDNIHLAVRALKAFSLPQNAHHHHLLAANERASSAAAGENAAGTPVDGKGGGGAKGPAGSEQGGGGGGGEEKDSVSGQTASAAGNSSVPGSGALAALSLLTKVFDISETLTSQWRLGDDDEKAAQYGAGGKGKQQHSAASSSSHYCVVYPDRLPVRE